MKKMGPMRSTSVGGGSGVSSSMSSSMGGNKQKQSSILLKVILLGDGGVGKSCLMNRFIQNRFDTSLFHTIGVEFLNKEVNYQDQGYTIQVTMTI